MSEEAFARTLNLLESEPVALRASLRCGARRAAAGRRTGARAHSSAGWKNISHRPITDLARDLHTKEAHKPSLPRTHSAACGFWGDCRFTKIFEEVSLVEAELRTDPAGIYPRSDFPPATAAARALEKIARQSRSTELDVARAAMRLTPPEWPNTCPTTCSPTASLQLEKATGRACPSSRDCARVAYRRATPIYIAALIVLDSLLHQPWLCGLPSTRACRATRSPHSRDCWRSFR